MTKPINPLNTLISEAILAKTSIEQGFRKVALEHLKAAERLAGECCRSMRQIIDMEEGE